MSIIINALTGLMKLRDAWPKINQNFTNIKTEVDAIVLGSADAEVGQAHVSTAKSKTFAVIDDRFEEIETDAIAHMAETVTGLFNVVTGYSADPTGITDSTAMLQAAIDASGVSKGIVYLPAGTFRITSKLISNAKCSIQGAGRDLTFIVSNSCDGLSLSGSNSSIKDITLVTDDTTYYGLTLEGDYMVVERVGFKGEIESTDYWSRSIYTKRLWYSTFENILAIGGVLNTHQRGYGFYADYSVNNTISNCNLIALDYCVYLSNATHPTNGYVNEGWTISDSILITSNHGVRAMAGTFFDVHDCVLDMIYQIPLYFETAGTGSITNNWIAVRTGGGISINIALGDRFVVTGNVVNSVVGQTGIQVSSNYNTISNNVIRNADIGILVVGNYCAVVGNVCVASTTYAIRVIGTNGQVQGNTYDTTYISITHATTTGQNDKLSLSEIVPLTGGISQTIDVPIPIGTFDVKPLIGIIQTTGDYNIIGQYLVDDVATSNINARFIVRRSDGTALPTGSIRFSILVNKRN